MPSLTKIFNRAADTQAASDTFGKFPDPPLSRGRGISPEVLAEMDRLICRREKARARYWAKKQARADTNAGQQQPSPPTKPQCPQPNLPSGTPTATPS